MPMHPIIRRRHGWRSGVAMHQSQWHFPAQLRLMQGVNPLLGVHVIAHSPMGCHIAQRRPCSHFMSASAPQPHTFFGQQGMQISRCLCEQIACDQETLRPLLPARGEDLHAILQHLTRRNRSCTRRSRWCRLLVPPLCGAPNRRLFVS